MERKITHGWRNCNRERESERWTGNDRGELHARDSIGWRERTFGTLSIQ